ncbi:MAG: PepSY-associated TM helix domain-containing protein [Luteimonas sp.]
MSIDRRHNASARRRVRSLLSWLHLWLGLTLGSMFALIALSGSVLVFHTSLLRWQYPQLGAHAPVADGAVLARVLARWTPQGLSTIDLPRQELPVWQGYFRDGTRRYFAPEDGALLLSRSEHDDALLWLHEWHTALLGGDAGQRVVGIIGWCACFMLLSGLYLWWPTRGRVLASLRMHAQPPLRRWLSWHRSTGAIALPLLLLLTLTGVGMVYHDGARALLTGLFGGDPPPAAPKTSSSASAMPIAPPWPRVLAVAQTALSGARLSRLSVPAIDSDAISFRAQAVGEWHPNGRSLVVVDAAGTRVRLRHDATRQPLGARLDEAIYPLHIGAVGGTAYRWAAMLGGLVPAGLLITGFLFWRRRTAQHRA